MKRLMPRWKMYAFFPKSHSPLRVLVIPKLVQFVIVDKMTGVAHFGHKSCSQKMHTHSIEHNTYALQRNIMRSRVCELYQLAITFAIMGLGLEVSGFVEIISLLQTLNLALHLKGPPTLCTNRPFNNDDFYLADYCFVLFN